MKCDLGIWIDRNPLKSHKTAKTFLGKAWHWNHRYLERLGIRCRINLEARGRERDTSSRLREKMARSAG
jgi:hypothetical protein